MISGVAELKLKLALGGWDTNENNLAWIKHLLTKSINGVKMTKIPNR